APTLPATTATATGYPVLVYFSKNPDSYNDSTLVFPVHRTSPTLGVATYAIQQLIAGPTPSEASAGYFTELSTVLQRGDASSCGGPDFKITLNMRGATPETGTATLQFCRQTASPGIGADARIKAEIVKTLTQFSNITKVVILLQNGHCFGDESGADLCLR
ncbi:MAG TPA: GerMN domain-containing protein, partial [Ktedonobacterales bacterium]|nr:GerMN domain-containing protein [Ktedonobacterales bacterium]